MKKTILFFLAFFILVVFVSVAFALFFPSQNIVEKQRFMECVLMKHKTSGEIDCYGCVKDICKDASFNWEKYDKTTSLIDIPYKCLETQRGCELSR